MRTPHTCFTFVKVIFLFWAIGLPVFAQNPIVTENALPGNPSSEWELPGKGIGDPSIQGFGTDMSFNRGTTASFKVDVTGAPTTFTINIYRLGYYQGNGARLITTLGPITGVDQPACLTDAPTGLVDCGNWSVSATWAIPANAVSGLYLAKLTRDDNGGSSHIAFVVRDDAGTADILFKTSDATWQAYNVYGGNSLYVGSVSGFPSGHAPKVSYNRPFYTRAGGGGGGAEEDWLFNCEYPMIRFMERNGYHVAYTTDLDMERDAHLFTSGPNPVPKHKVFLSVGHDEYWSANERSSVEAARDAGMHLAFFSGNEVYWRTRWETSIDGSGTPFRTLVCYKEGTQGENTCGGKCDPSPEWTGLWRDGCNFPGSGGCNPENSLTGQMSWDGTTATIQVPADFSALRFWRNTPNIEDLTTGQTQTLTPGTLGYEWDPYQPQYAATYPAGRVLLSRTNFNGNVHHASLYKHSSGALVFGAGTVQWMWGLDDNHDRGNDPVSPDMQQAAINLFADMDVQPGSLMAGMVPAIASTDVTPPISTITSPLNGATLALNSLVIIQGTGSDADGVIAGQEISVDGGVTWVPLTGGANWTYNWIPGTQGNVTVLVRGFDDSGNLESPAIGQPNAIEVTVGPPGPANCPCTIWPSSITPAIASENDPNAVELGVKFRSNIAGYITGIRFFKGLQNTGTHTGNLWTTSGTNLGTVVFTNETATGWQEALFSSPVFIDANTTYIASYHTTSGNYAKDDSYFASNGFLNNPLQALANGVDGPNGVYVYSGVSAFPNQTFQSTNYWVDVVFETSIGPDLNPPVVQSVVPLINATAVGVNSAVSATFNEAIDPATLSSTNFTLETGGLPIQGTITFNAATRTANFVAGAALQYSTTYTATLTGGAGGIADLAGNVLLSNFSWSFTTAGPPPPPPTDGPGGPILVISSTSNPFSRFTVEMLRAQGLNSFFAMDASQVSASVLAAYDVAILGDFSLSSGLVNDLTNWVDGGGTLIAFSPDAQLSTLLGLTYSGNTQNGGYLLVNTATGPGAGIVGQTIQYHGLADLWTLNGASAIATLYANATTATPFPAVTLREVGPNGGKAIAFTYDLARSVVYTRQGNPAWSGQNRDVNAAGSDGVIRSNDLFYGDAPFDPQPDWVDLNKVSIPQADEQMHLLTNLILQGNLHRKPLPRFWFLPNNFKAAVVMTGDDHGVGLTSQFFDQFLAASPSNSAQAVANWQAVRGSSYMYTNTPLPGALAYQAQGFEVGIHINTGCAVWTPASLASDYSTQLGQFAANFPGIFPPTTHRTHCIAWSDYDTQPKVSVANGIRLDGNYYYWPGAWVQNRPGMFTGSGMPMRFAEVNGTLIDCYQLATQMTDESGQTIPTHIASLLDNAVGANQFYGVFCANMHTDRPSSLVLAQQIISAAQSRGVPVVSSRQMLEWLDGRNGSSFQNMTWTGASLNFDVAIGAGAVNLYGMLPVQGENGQLISLSLGGSPVTYSVETIKGMSYALFPANPGSYVATYGVDTDAPVITNVQVTTDPSGTATITWSTNEPATSVVNFGLTGGALSQNVSASALVTSHSLQLTGLTASQTYDFRVASADAVNNLAESPASPAVLSFTMPAAPAPPCGEDNLAADFQLGTPDANTVVTAAGDGGVSLRATIDESFGANTLPAGWASGVWNPGGAVTFGGGNVTVNGANIYSVNPFGAGTVATFEAVFQQGPFQNVGFAGDGAFNNPWVTVGTGPSGDAIYARASDNSQVLLFTSAQFGVSHRYEIRWTNTGFEFFVDNGATPAATLPFVVTGTMVAQISDFPSVAPSLSVSQIRITPFVANGSFTSRVFDQGASTAWGAANWQATLPAGTSLSLFARTGNTAVPDGSWTSYLPLSNGANIGVTARYLQYRADFSTTDTRFSPVLERISIACDGTPDTDAPVISNVTVVPAPDGLSATISWSTNEPANSSVNFGTNAGALNQNAGASLLVTSHSVVISGLTPGTGYFFRVSSADAANNQATVPAPPSAPLSFTTPSPSSPCAADLTLTDFLNGTAQGVLAFGPESGLILDPALESDFSALPSVSEWAAFSWTGGTATVNAGVLSVDGARYNTQPQGTTYGPGSGLEFVATFGASGFQHVGFGGGTDATGSGGIYNGEEPWAMFSTSNTTNSVFARVFDGVNSFNVPIPLSLVGTSHRYRLDWTATGFDFYVDGALVHTQPTVISTGMRPAISDFNSGGPAVQVDWLVVKPYPLSGNFTSRVFDAGAAVNWTTANWTSSEPAGSLVQLFHRQGNTPSPDGSWSAFAPVASNGSTIGGTSRYIQYRADLSTTSAFVSPVLSAVTIGCTTSNQSAPVVSGDPVSASGCEGAEVVFSAAATGNPLPAVQWQVSVDNGQSWQDIPGAVNDSLELGVTAAMNGFLYRATFTNGVGSPVSSQAATLTVLSVPSVSLSLVSPAICEGTNPSLQVNIVAGASPVDLVINGLTYENLTDGQVFLTRSPVPEATIWPNTAVPGTPFANDGQPIEVGVKFRTTTGGLVSGIRFYKGVGNNGQHTGNLWTASGNLLASALFVNETASGWQEVRFASPVEIEANTTYIASYLSADGGFAIDAAGLTNAVSSGPLTALAAGTDGPNGVFRYGGGFPSQGNNANYWVDVLFGEIDQTAVFNLTTVTGANGCVVQGNPIESETQAYLPVPSGTLTSPAGVFCEGADPELVFNAASGLTGPFSLTINGAVYNNVSSGVPFTLPGTSLTDQSIWTLNPSPNNADDNEPLVVGVKFRSVTAGVISGIRFFKGWSNAGPLTYTVRLYSNGTQASPGNLLGEGTVVLDDTQTGWQEVQLLSPVNVQANTVYIASFESPGGNYSFTGNYFQNAYNEPQSPLTALATGDPSGPNGVFVYSNSPGSNVGFPFPSYSFNAGNYWVDVLFRPATQTFTLTRVESGGCVNTGPNLSSVTLSADTIAPVPDVPNLPVLTGECGLTITTFPTATDNCEGTVNGTTSDPLTYNTEGTFTVNWTFDDGNGNSTTAMQTVIIDDVTAPATPTLATITGECGATVPVPSTTDNCAVTVLGTTSDPLVYTTQGTFQINWTFNDGNGNSTTATQTVIIDDVTAPATPTLATITGECEATVPVPATTDNCVSIVNGTTSDPLSYSSQGTFQINWTFDDGNGNTTTATQTVIIDDVTAPATPTLATITGECGASVPVPSTTDNCVGTVIGTTTDPLTYSSQGTFTVNWTFDDGNGNTATAIQTVVIDDVTAPATPTLATITGECGATVPVPTTTDNCVSIVNGTTTDPLSYSTQGTFTVNWTFDDGNGNSTTATQTVIVEDVTPPTALCQDINVQLDANGNASITASQIDNGSSDTCGIQSISVSPSTFTTANLGANQVTLTVTDVNGLVSTCNATVTVIDYDAPIALCQNITIQLDASGNASITASQIDGGSSAANGIQSISASQTSFDCSNVGANTVILTVTDNNNVVSTCSATVTVEDNIAPATPTLATITGECGATVPVPATTDNCVSIVNGTTTDPLSYSIQGTFIVNWTFDDGNGNTTTATQTVIVDDVTAPATPTLATITGECGATVPVPSTTDNCTGTIDGTTFDPLTYTTQGTFTVNWTFDDGNGNSTTAIQTVVIDDVTAPATPTLATITGECGATVPVPSTTDNCAVTVPGTTTDPLVYTTQGTFQINWTFDDGNGNSTTAMQTVIIDDVTAPATPTLATITGECGATVLVPTTTDNCVGAVNGTTSDPLSYSTQGTFTVNWTFDDGNGNTTTATQTVIVEDVTPPTALCQDINVQLDANGNASITAAQIDNGSSDNCGIQNISVSPNTFTTANVGANAVILTVTDVNGLVTTCTATVTVQAPILTLAGNGQLITNGDLTPGLADDTDFGLVPQNGGNMSRTFTVTNTGSADLMLSSIGTNNAKFSITGFTANTVVAPNGSTNFVVAFDDSGTGAESAVVTVVSNDSENSPFTFGVKAEAFACSIAGLSGLATVCVTDAPFDLSTVITVVTPGGSWSYNGNPLTGSTFTPGTDPAGVYTYTVTGQNGCASSSASATIIVSTCAPVGPLEIFGDTVVVLPFTASVTIPVRVKNYSEVLLGQGSVRWNANVLDLTSVSNYGLPYLDASSVFQANDSTLNFSYADFSGFGSSLPDSAILFELTFSVLSGFGTASDVTVADAPVPLLFSDLALNPLTVISVPGRVEVNPLVPISVEARSELGDAIPTVTFTATGLNGTSTQAGNVGTFQLSDGSTQQFGAFKNNDVDTDNGINTLDIIRIQRHIQGVTQLASPYRILAADVNNSNGINVLDVILMRQMVLQTRTYFPSATGINDRLWTFVGSDVQFPNPASPFLADSFLTVRRVRTTGDYHLIGVKLGDVDNTWNPLVARPQVAGTVGMNLDAVTGKAGEWVEMAVRAQDFGSVSGYQGTLTWDASVLEFGGVTAGATAVHVATDRVQEGKLPFTWNEPAGGATTVADGEALFTLRFRTKGAPNAAVNLSSDLVALEAYTNDLNLLLIEGNAGEVRTEGTTSVDVDETDILWFRNDPNPFTDETVLKFNILKRENVEIQVTNALGQLVRSWSDVFEAGEHEILWRGETNGGSRCAEGVYLCTIRHGGMVQTIQVVLAH